MEANYSYLDTLDDLHRDCRSGDPDRKIFCIGATILGAMAFFLVPLVVVFGLLGNGFTSYILLSRRRLRSRQNVYLAMIALSDCANLLCWGVMWQFLAKGLPWISDGSHGFFIMNVSDLACRLFRFLHNFFHLLSANWFLLMSADRMMTVCRPLQLHRRSVSCAAKLLAFIFVVSLALTCPVPALIGWNYVDGKISCLVMTEYGRAVQVGAMVYMSVAMFPPTVQLLAIAVCDVLLLRKLMLNSRRRQHLRQLCAGGHSPACDFGSDLRPSVLVLVLSTLYFVCCMPATVAHIVHLHLSALTSDRHRIQFDAKLRTVLNIGDIGHILLLLHQAAGWTVLFCNSRAFRAECGAALACRDRRARRRAAAAVGNRRCTQL